MLRVEISHRLARFDLEVAFEAPPGITVLYGRSGCGKTTIMQVLAGLLRPDRADLRVGTRVLSDGRIWVPPHRRRMGTIFQDARLFPHLSVRQNLLYGARFAQRRPSRAERDRVIEMLGLGALLRRAPRTLSGGEQQRVAIGRALLSDPLAILADEPLSALDTARKEEVLPYFERLRDETDLPVVYVSHDPSEVARLATTVVALEAGRVTRIGPAEAVLADPSVLPLGAQSAGAILLTRVVRHHDDGLTELDASGVPLWVPRVAQAPGQPVRVRLAARDVILSRDAPGRVSALNVISARILALQTGKGPGVLVSLHSPAGAFLARITQRSAAALELAEGMEIQCILKTMSIAPQDVFGT